MRTTDAKRGVLLSATTTHARSDHEYDHPRIKATGVWNTPVAFSSTALVGTRDHRPQWGAVTEGSGVARTYMILICE